MTSEAKIEKKDTNYVIVDLGDGETVKIEAKPGIQHMMDLYAVGAKITKRSVEISKKRSDKPLLSGCLLLSSGPIC